MRVILNFRKKEIEVKCKIVKRLLGILVAIGL